MTFFDALVLTLQVEHVFHVWQDVQAWPIRVLGRGRATTILQRLQERSPSAQRSTAQICGRVGPLQHWHVKAWGSTPASILQQGEVMSRSSRKLGLCNNNVVYVNKLNGFILCRLSRRIMRLNSVDCFALLQWAQGLQCWPQPPLRDRLQRQPFRFMAMSMAVTNKMNTFWLTKETYKRTKGEINFKISFKGKSTYKI